MNIPILGKAVEYNLKIFGLWPDYFNNIGVVFIASGLFTLLPFQVWDCMNQFDDILLMLDDVSHILTVTLCYMKFLIIWYNRRTLKSLLVEMAEDYEDEAKLEDWSEIISKSHRFSKFDYAIYLSINSLYYLQFILAYPKISIENRELILKSYYPFDFRRSPLFEIIAVVQIAQGLAFCGIHALCESLLVTLVLHVGGHIDLLLQKIDEFSENCESNRINVSLAPIINQHLKVLNIVHKVEIVYTYVLLVQILISTLIICFVVFVTINLSGDVVMLIKFILLCMLFSWQGYSFCFSGQRLINKSDTISNKIYEASWFNANPKEIRAICYVINRAQSPLTLTVGKFTSLSAQTFTAMMKTSFSYLSVLRASEP